MSTTQAALTARTYDPIEAYRRLYLIRHVEEEIVRRYHPTSDLTESPMRVPVHLSIGQEGVAIGVAMAVPPGTHAYSTHRCHAHYLAWGGSLGQMLGELYGRTIGCAGGRAGSMHLHDSSVGFMGTSAIVGSSISLAVGDAFAVRLDKRDRLTVAFGGDAVLETGQFWEALNFASLHKLRILFVIEDNGLSTATPKSKRQRIEYPLRWRSALDDSAAGVAAAVGSILRDSLVPGVNVWPAVLMVKTRRFYEHVGMARMPEYDPYPDDDPVTVGERVLFSKDLSGSLEEAIEEQVAAAFAAAEAAPWPGVTDA